MHSQGKPFYTIFQSQLTIYGKFADFNDNYPKNHNSIKLLYNVSA